MRAELVVELQMRAFAEQMQVQVGQDRREAVASSISTSLSPKRARSR